MRIHGWIVVIGLLVSCVSPAIEPAPADVIQPTPTLAEATAAASKPAIEVASDVPPVNITRHSVPLEEVYFDTFQPINRAVPLSTAQPELIERLRDAIPPIHNPKYEPASEAQWLRDDDTVIGYAAGDEAWAYPVRILNYHEIVNERLGGEDVLISYCPLCFSGIVFSRVLDDQVLTFGNTSALYESDMVMLDYETGSYWWQVAGQAIVGDLTGKTLTVLPSATTSWGEWKSLHPSTLVLSPDTGFSRRYGSDSFQQYAEYVNSGNFAFPVSDAGKDPRLLPGETVFAVKIGEEVRGYPIAQLEGSAIADKVGGQDIVVFTSQGGSLGAAFEPVAADQELSFEIRNEDIIDLETGSVWDMAGRAVSGPLTGQQLIALPSKTSYWFAIVAAEPAITLYQAQER